MENTFKVSGFSFKTTPIEIREQLALNESEAKILMRFLAEDLGAQDLLVLSTCNRTEIYYSHSEELHNAIATQLALMKTMSKSAIAEHIICLGEGQEAVNHLFEVAMGLDAQVIGDIQISNQVKNAYQWSADENLAGPYLHRLMHTIFYTNKRVVQETSFRDGAASVSYVAKELIEDVTTEFLDPKILILGLGEIGADVCRNFVGTGKSVTIANRTKSKAIALATECNFEVIDLKSALNGLKDYDVIVSSISHNEPVVTKSMINQFEILSHKIFIDLSVPRSIDTQIEDIHGVLLYNIDNIQSKASEALNKRVEAIPHVKRIIVESMSEFNDWSKEMAVSPTIKKLKSALENIRQEEMKRFLKDDVGDNAKIVDAVTKSMMQKIIKLPVLQLKAACKRGEAETLIDVLNDLFDLDKTSEKTTS